MLFDVSKLVDMVLDFDTAQNQSSSTPTPTGVAILSMCGVIAVALIGAWVEIRKQRLSQEKVEHEVTPPRESDASLRDEIKRLQTSVDKIDEKVDAARERLIRVETKVDPGGFGRRATDR